MAPAQVLARLEPDIAGTREKFPHRLAQVPEAAAGIEHALHGEAEVGRVGADESPEPQRVRARSHASARVDVITLVEVGVEHQAESGKKGTFTFFLRSFGKKVNVPFFPGSVSYSTVTLFARLRGWSTSVPFSTAA